MGGIHIPSINSTVLKRNMASRSLKRFGALVGVGGLFGITYYYNTRNPFEESCGKQVQGHAKTGHADGSEQNDEVSEEERISRRQKIAKSKFYICYYYHT